MLSNTAYTIASKLHLIPTGGDVEAGYTQLPGGARAEAERRRWVYRLSTELFPDSYLDLVLWL